MLEENIPLPEVGIHKLILSYIEWGFEDNDTTIGIIDSQKQIFNVFKVDIVKKHKIFVNSHPQGVGPMNDSKYMWISFPPPRHIYVVPEKIIQSICSRKKDSRKRLFSQI